VAIENSAQLQIPTERIRSRVTGRECDHDLANLSAVADHEMIAKTKKTQNGCFCRSFFSPPGCLGGRSVEENCGSDARAVMEAIRLR